MLFKTIAVALALLAAPLAAQVTQQGVFEDGSAVVWLCENKAKGNVKFAFITKEGVVYQGVLSCGQQV